MQGLSEPVGALLALLVVKPFLTPRLVHLMLAFVGGIMASPSQTALSMPAPSSALLRLNAGLRSCCVVFARSLLLS